MNEHISSSILRIIGYSVHETFLATYKNELIVCCKNFTSETEKLIKFGRFLRAHYDSGEVGRVPDLQQLKTVFSQDEILLPYQEVLWQSYWKRFIGDAFTGNFDRHMGNFGYLVSQTNVKPSPIYDNGSTFFPALSESKMQFVLSDQRETLLRTRLFPKAALTINGPKVSYYDVLTSGYIPVLSELIVEMVPLIQSKMEEINIFIDTQPYLSDVRKEFFKTILQVRLKYILQPAYKCCISENYDTEAFIRISQGINYHTARKTPCFTYGECQSESLFDQDFANIII